MLKSRSKDALTLLHPSVELVFTVFAVILIGISMQIAFALMMLAWCLIMEAIVNGVSSMLKSLRMVIPVIVVFTLLNVLFYQNDGTVLFQLGPISISLESMLFGICAGCMLSSMILLLRLAGEVISSDSASSLMSSSMPTLGLMLSMVLRLVPQLQRRAKDVRNTALACTCSNAKASDVRMSMGIHTTLMSWAMEDSIETASSMRARGWTRERRRTFFNRRPFGKVDAFDMAVVIALGTLSLVLVCITLNALSGMQAASDSLFGKEAVLLSMTIASCVAFLLLPIGYIIAKRTRWQR